jgi:cysteine synthase
MGNIGSSLLYANLAQAQLDDVMHADEDATAIEMAHYLLKKEGLFLGYHHLTASFTNQPLRCLIS